MPGPPPSRLRAECCALSNLTLTRAVALHIVVRDGAGVAGITEAIARCGTWEARFPTTPSLVSIKAQFRRSPSGHRASCE